MTSPGTESSYPRPPQSLNDSNGDEDGNRNEDRIGKVGRKSKKRMKWSKSCRSRVEKERVGSVEKKDLVQ